MSAGSTLGAALAFLVSRYAARPLVAERLGRSARFRAIDTGLRAGGGEAKARPAPLASHQGFRDLGFFSKELGSMILLCVCERPLSRYISNPLNAHLYRDRGGEACPAACTEAHRKSPRADSCAAL